MANHLLDKRLISKNIRCSNKPIARLTIANICKQSKCPTLDEWIKNKRYIPTMENYSSFKKKKKNNKILPFVATWVALEMVKPNEITQTHKDKYFTILLTYII